MLGWIQQWDLFSIFWKLFLALVCGGVLGIERGRKKRPAGFRTYMLVCLGAALAMMTNDYIFQLYGMGDPTRMGAQVISGIGFLGAGTIIVIGNNRVKGLTTAAGLWASACIGLAIGIGFYAGAVIGTIMIFFAIAALHNVDERMMGSARVVVLYIEIGKVTDIGNLIRYSKEHNYKITDFEITHSEVLSGSEIILLVTLQLASKQSREIVVSELRLVEGVKSVEEL